MVIFINLLKILKMMLKDFCNLMLKLRGAGENLFIFHSLLSQVSLFHDEI